MSRIYILNISGKIALVVGGDAKKPHLWLMINIGSGIGLVPSGNKPLPEPMSTKFYVSVLRH